MREEKITANIGGQPREITIDSSPSWGKLQTLLTSLVSIDDNGNQKIDMMAFLNKVLEVCIISGFDEYKDKVKLLQIDGDEVTYILGEIIKKLPLEKYQKNLGMDAGGALKGLI